MFKRIRCIKVVAKNRCELYWSFVIVVVGFQNGAGLPRGYEGSLTLAGSLLLGLVCALNAILDGERMNIVERAIALCWFALLLFVTPLACWSVAQIEAFSPR